MATVLPKTLRGHLAGCTTLVIGLGLSLLIWLNNDPQGPVLVLIIVAGAFGGLVNNYKRSSLIPVEGQEDGAVEITGFQIYMSPVIGASLAVALYMLFLSGLVSGELFPSFAKGEDALDNPMIFMNSMLPETNGDLAKAVFWSFLAGFSERFVPDLLSNAARRVGEGDKGEQ